MNGDDGDMRLSAVLKLFAFTVQAIQALKSTPDWMTATEKLSLQEHGLVKGRDIWRFVMFRTAG
ncbi:hypothetical protein E4U49_006017 [Claviceps purpurea]|nr:hypothetical protein E4U49_006017 [Claviceps purpurea]